MARKPRQQSQAFSDPPIFTIRGQRVILDADLARLYAVTTKALNQAVKRNEHRFPDDFVFQLKATEVENLRSSDRDLSAQTLDGPSDAPNWSHFVTSSSRHRGAAYRPWVFTEHGTPPQEFPNTGS
jgi:ORF6N domain